MQALFFRFVVLLNSIVCFVVTMRLCAAWSTPGQILFYAGSAIAVLGLALTLSCRNARKRVHVAFAGLSLILTFATYLLMTMGAFLGHFGFFAPVELLLPIAAISAALLALVAPPSQGHGRCKKSPESA